jgi:hypothetical protein
MVIAELAAKPVPVTVTVFPTCPLVGEGDIVGIVLNALWTEFDDVSVAVTV